MRLRRFALTGLLLFLLAVAWNGLVHLVLLRDAAAAIGHLHRPDLADKLWLSLWATAGTVALFLWGYGRFARTGSVREALGYGLFFACLAGLLADLNQYVLYPIPGRLAFAWFAGGLLEFTLYALLVRRLCPVSVRAKTPPA